MKSSTPSLWTTFTSAPNSSLASRAAVCLGVSFGSTFPPGISHWARLAVFLCSNKIRPRSSMIIAPASASLFAIATLVVPVLVLFAHTIILTQVSTTYRLVMLFVFYNFDQVSVRFLWVVSFRNCRSDIDNFDTLVCNYGNVFGIGAAIPG